MKRLYKSRRNKVIDGVCGGIAEYLDVDPVLVRLVAVLFIFMGGSAVIAYIIGMIIIPTEPSTAFKSSETTQDSNAIPAPPVNKESRSYTGSLIFGIIMIAFGAHFLLRNIPFFSYYYWRFWNLGWHFFWPSVLILIGLLIILRSVRK
jgi:phage shock protein C